jgi:predicted patatin/cPLA2 family phospholipase
MEEIKTLVLEGCGPSGFFIVGYLQKAFDDKIINFNTIENYIACSSGSMCCFLLSIGYTPLDIVVYVAKYSGINSSFEELRKIKMVNMFNGQGIISFDILKKIIVDMTIEKIGYMPTFNDIKTKFNKTLVFSVYNLNKKKVEYMSYENYPDLDCIDCIQMSSAIPIIFQEVVYRENRYVDGGVGNGFPLEISDLYDGNTLAISIRYDDYPMCFIYENPLKYLFSMYFIAFSELKKNKKKNKKNYIHIDLDITKADMHDVLLESNIQILDMFSFGYKQYTIQPIHNASEKHDLI